MGRHVALLRGINVGGKNMVKMTELAEAFRQAGLADVTTYINSGNVVFSADAPTERTLEQIIEARFGLAIPVLLRTRDEIAAVVNEAPSIFGDPAYRCDVWFLKAPRTAPATVAALPPLADGIDQVWPGSGVVYFARLDAQASKTKLTKIVGTPLYKELSIRNWNTTRKLLDLLDA